VAITVIAGTASASNGGAPAPTIPGTPQAGDWMIAFYASREATDGTVSLPAGWDQRVNDRGTGGLVAAWTRPWQSGDAAPAFTLGGHNTGSTGDSNQAVIHLVRPTAGQTLEFVDASTPSHNASSSTTVGPIDGDSLTVAANGIVFVLGQHRETWTSVATLSGDGLTWAQETDNSNSSGADNALAIDWALSNNVAVTDKSYTITGSGGAATGSGFMLFLKEVAGVTLNLSATEDGDSLQASAIVAAVSEILRISWAQLEIPEAPEVTSTASLSAIELGDTLVGAIALSISSALSALEDQDTLAAGVGVGAAAEILRISWAQLEIPEGAGISASLSATDGADTLNASASLNVVATLSALEDADLLSSSTSVAAGAEILRISWAQLEIPEGGSITASLSATEGRDTLSASATVEGNESLSVDAFSITISFESATRAFAVTAAPFAITASFADADLEWSGGARLIASIVEEGDSLSAAATVSGQGVITADASLLEDVDVVAASAAVAISASAAVVEASDTLVADVNATGSVNVSLSVQELDDVVSGSATLALAAQAALVEDADVLAASAAVTIVASASVLEDADSLTGQVGTPQIAADVAATESDDTVTASASLSVAASVSITEADDLSSASVSVFIVANASMTEEDDDFTGGWGRQLFPAHVGVTNRGRGPRGSSGGGGPLGSSRSKGSITTTEWP
jgi:chemotaxis signal transduction protein